MGDSLWWSAWLGWAVIWGVAVVSSCAAVVLLVVRLRKWRAALARSRRLQGTVFYLDRVAVFELSRLHRSVKPTRQAVSIYDETVDPIPIAIVNNALRALRRADGVVDVDLRTQQYTTSRRRPGQLRMSEFEQFVIVKGVFRMAGDGQGAVSLLAPYGTPAEPRQGRQVRVTCKADGLLQDLPDGTFQARCLGTVQGWNSRSRELEMHAIAVFI